MEQIIAETVHPEGPKFVSKPLLISSSEVLKTDNYYDNIELRKTINGIVSKQTVVITGMIRNGTLLISNLYNFTMHLFFAFYVCNQVSRIY